MKNYYTTKKYITRFLQNTFKVTDIFLAQVSYKLITDFECFLRNHKPLDHHKPIANNGVMKHLGRLRKIINLGQRTGWISKNPFDSYKFSYREVERGFLTEKELNLKLKNSGLNVWKLSRTFLFSVVTQACLMLMQSI